MTNDLHVATRRHPGRRIRREVSIHRGQGKAVVVWHSLKGGALRMEMDLRHAHAAEGGARTLPFDTGDVAFPTYLKQWQSTVGADHGSRSVRAQSDLIDYRCGEAAGDRFHGPGVVPVRLEIWSPGIVLRGIFTVEVVGAFATRGTAGRLRERRNAEYGIFINR